MQKRHKDRLLYFNEQAYTTKKYVIPFLEQVVPITSSQKPIRVLEVGCGEGGNIKPFLDLGLSVTGVDLNFDQIENAKRFFCDHPNKTLLKLYCQDFYTFSHEERYDIIILRDVIEHIPHQERFMCHLEHFLSSDGVVFFGFPPYFMPFAGHQQICQSFLSHVPFIHLFPTWLYRAVLSMAGERKSLVNALIDIKHTGITIERFERCIRQAHLRIVDRVLWFIQPNYEIKFRLKPKKVCPLLGKIPYVRDFYTTAGYYLIGHAR